MGSFQLFWRIENFCNCSLRHGQNISSPIISLKTFSNTNWCLELYPNRNLESEDRELVKINLKRTSDSGPVNVYVTFRLNVHSKNNIAQNTKFCQGQVLGFNFPVSEVRNLKSFVVSCHIVMKHVDLKVDRPYFMNPVFSASAMSNDVSLNTERELLKVQKNLVPHPERCLINSRCLVEKRCFFWPINLQENKIEQEIPVLSFTDALPLLIKIRLRKEEGKKFLTIDISPGAILQRIFMLVTKITILDDDEKIYDTVKRQHLFAGNYVWSSNYNFMENQTHTLFSQNVYLKCEMEFSNNSFTHEIVWLKDDVSKMLESNISFRSTSRNIKLKNFDKEKFSDVTLCTKDKTFKAHKFTLSAASPVFEAMFDSGMKESVSNEVKMDDIDSKILEKMIVYIYSGTFDDINYDCAMKLYAVADKYQIKSLKDQCRLFFIGKFDPKNFYPLLRLAYLYNDSILEEKIVENLSVYESSILESPEWKRFMSDYPKIACKILMKLHLK